MSTGYFRYWGKADREDPSQFHLLVYHSLDVAAVGRVLLEGQPKLLRNLSNQSGIRPERLIDWITFLLALHDIGKFADSFQNLIPDLFNQLQGRAFDTVYRQRHDTLGFRYLDQYLIKAISREESSDLRDLLLPWLNAVCGHHGQPPKNDTDPRPLGKDFPAMILTDANSFVAFVRDKFLPDGFPFGVEEYRLFCDRFPRISWLVAGLAVASDWIGSNSSWFRYCKDQQDLNSYWQTKALPNALTAVNKSGFIPVVAQEYLSYRRIFPGIAQLTPLQEHSENLKITDTPGLFILEEVTGGGKTEAAFILAQRLMAKGLADGIFMALPTMATANAMYKRVRAIYKKLFQDDADPSLVLAHSSGPMVLKMEKNTRLDHGYGGDESSATQDCAAWFSDNRKKALLAHVGVGTIDQALLSILPVRHQSLRLLGLYGKVLVVDEVHANDDYVHKLLCSLLKFHASFGGSAILLSATLPQQMRKELLKAYAEGRRLPAPEVMEVKYPLLTYYSEGQICEHAVAARREMSREVRVNLIYTEQQVYDAIQAALNKGHCVCWVRNTIVDALQAYRYWQTRMELELLTLFHSRFALSDRLEIENKVLDYFGPDSASNVRKGRLLIATQVAEQSLDLDFDFMVTDLAPIDLVIQRAGRLQRHARGNRTPVLAVYTPMPEPEAKSDWYKKHFPKAARVYPHHGQLWLTARWLCERRSFRMPEYARDMIEFVFSESSYNAVPPDLQMTEDKSQGADQGKKSMARFNSLDLNQGYKQTLTHWQDDAFAPTRLGEPTVTLRLARWQDNRLVPWIEVHDEYGWQLSQLSVRKYYAAAEYVGEHAVAFDEARRSMRDQGKYVLLVPLIEKNGIWCGSVLNCEGAVVDVVYTVKFGAEFV